MHPCWPLNANSHHTSCHLCQWTLWTLLYLLSLGGQRIMMSFPLQYQGLSKWNRTSGKWLQTSTMSPDIYSGWGEYHGSRCLQWMRWLPSPWPFLLTCPQKWISKCRPSSWELGWDMWNGGRPRWRNTFLPILTHAHLERRITFCIYCPLQSHCFPCLPKDNSANIQCMQR